MTLEIVEVTVSAWVSKVAVPLVMTLRAAGRLKKGAANWNVPPVKVIGPLSGPMAASEVTFKTPPSRFVPPA